MVDVFQKVLLYAALAGLAFLLPILIAKSKAILLLQARLLNYWRSLTPLGRIAVMSFLTIGILYGGSKTNSAPRLTMMRPTPSTKMSYAERKVQNWNIRGAWKDSFWLKFADGWRFPYGTNHLRGVEVISYGELWQTPFDNNAVASLGAQTEIVPTLTSFSYELTPSNSYRFVWENAAINRDTNNLVTASLELFRNGDACIVTNGAVNYKERELPSEWGDPSEGEFYGNDNTLPSGADEGAYYWIDIVVSNATAKVKFVGEGESNYPDPDFVAKENTTNRVVLLIGKPYTVTCDEAIGIIAKSDADINVEHISENEIKIIWPLQFDVSHETMYATPRAMTTVPIQGGFSIETFPLLTGVYIWETNKCCDFKSESLGNLWKFSCQDDCYCTGCSFEGVFVYEGYRHPVVDLSCGCTHKEEPSATASISFSKSAVIFENCYTNAPNDIVPRRSTTNSLDITIYGGPFGGSAEIEFDDKGKLEYLTQEVIPRSICVVAEETVNLSFPFTAQEESASEKDLKARLKFSENFTGDIIESEDEMTAVRVEVEAEAVWPENKHRHVFGPREEAKIKQYPSLPELKFAKFLRYGGSVLPSLKGTWKIINGRECDSYTVEGACEEDDSFEFVMNFSVVEPISIRAENEHCMTEAEINLFNAQQGFHQIPALKAGFAGVLMKVDLYLEPNYVSFSKLKVFEGYAPTSNRQGWYEDYNFFPEELMRHGTPNLPIEKYMLSASGIDESNEIIGGDIAGGWIGSLERYYGGSYELNIPVYWFVVEDDLSAPKLFTTCVQKTYIYENGKMRIEKFGKAVERSLNESLD